MDEKYVELRIRFDQSRSMFHNHVNKVMKENADLRKKYSLAFGTITMLDTFDATNKEGSASNGKIRAKSANSMMKPISGGDSNRQQQSQQLSPDGKHYKDEFILMMQTPNNSGKLFNSTAKSSNLNTPSNNNNNNDIGSPSRNQSASIIRRVVHINDDNSITKGMKEKEVLKKISKRSKKKEWTREQLRELIPKF